MKSIIALYVIIIIICGAVYCIKIIIDSRREKELELSKIALAVLLQEYFRTTSINYSDGVSICFYECMDIWSLNLPGYIAILVGHYVRVPLHLLYILIIAGGKFHVLLVIALALAPNGVWSKALRVHPTFLLSTVIRDAGVVE